MKFLNPKRLKYIIYMTSVIILILAAFNTFLTFRIHNQIKQIVTKPGEWPAGAYIHDPDIGFDFAPNISGLKPNGSYYVKSHQLGYRISEKKDAEKYRSGGLLSLGCSFTYGDEVEAWQTFTQLTANGLRIPVYNYGICSFSYTHALLKAQKLKKQGVLDKLQPKYILLGCWSGLPSRSRLPFPPRASRQLPMPAAYMTKDGDEVRIQAPLNMESVFRLIDLYREEGVGMNFKKFGKIFTSMPGFISLYLKNNSLYQKLNNHTFKSDVSDYEVYDFYFAGIQSIFSEYGAQIIVLHMPNNATDQPDQALKDAVANHPGITLVNGLDGIDKHRVPVADFQGVHPRPVAHMAYAREILNTITQ